MTHEEQVFTIAIKIEEAAARIYRTFKGRFDHDPVLEESWHRLAAIKVDSLLPNRRADTDASRA